MASAPDTAGRLRHRLTIQAETRDQNGYGEETRSWSDVAEVWGEAKCLAGREAIRAQQTCPEANWLVTIRWRPGITSDMRVVYDGRILNIGFVRQGTVTDRLELECIEAR